MFYKLERLPEKKSKRYTIGLFDVYGPAEYSSQLASGVFEAAKVFDLNIVRFANHDAVIAMNAILQPNAILEHINQYSLDALIFVGWIRDYKSFVEKINIPLFCIGTEFENVPCVYFPGDTYLRELLMHLIKEHQYKNIAYIAPYWSDSRNDTYTEIMKEHALYRPELLVEDQWGMIELECRAKKVLSVLLDERELKLDAIISVYSREAVALLNELKARGIKVPYDIAIAGYEDSEAAMYSLPSITSIYFPWKELGFTACKRMVEMLQGKEVPKGTCVEGRINYRRSCGCHTKTIKFPSMKDILHREDDNLEVESILGKMKEVFPDSGIDYSALLNTFLNDYHTRKSVSFIPELESQLQKVQEDKVLNIGNEIFFLRTCIMPYITDKYLVESLFHQAQILINELTFNMKANEKLQIEPLNLHLQEMSQVLSTDFSIQNISKSLAENLPKLNIPSCYIILSDYDQSQTELFEKCSLVFEYSDFEWKQTSIENKSAKEILEEKLFPKDRNYLLNTYLLHVTKAFIGFVIFESGTFNGWVFQSLSIHLSNALWGAILLEKLENSYRKLVSQAHREGMADIATGILHNVGNILNSINISVQSMDEALKLLPVDDLLKANQILEDNLSDVIDFIQNNPKGRKLLQFYLKLGEPFKDTRDRLQYHVKRLDDKIGSIEDIINAQQNYAGVKVVLEEYDIVSILEDVLTVLSNSLEVYNIKVVRNYLNKPAVLVQRTKVFHVLVNIINNAKDAMKNNPEDARVLTLTVFNDSSGKYLRINDNGCGISKESVESIFAYGFTTKIDGHGFGLHSSANYMIEMGGKMWAESEGVGKGATFVLQFK